MDESNKQLDGVNSFIKAHKDITLPSISFLLVIDDKDQQKTFQSMMIESFNHRKLDLHVFHSAEDCCEFVQTKVATNEPIAFNVLVQLDYVSKVIEGLIRTPEVLSILVLASRPPTSEEQVVITSCPKADIISKSMKIENPQNMTYDRLNEPITMNGMCNATLVEVPVSWTDQVNRSAQSVISMDAIFRHLVIRCLLDTESSSDNHKELIELLSKRSALAPDLNNILTMTYSSREAIRFYTRYDFIYKELNDALRSMKLLDLIAFRFILKDIYEQLRDIMTHEPNPSPTTLYRGQEAEFYEIIDLFNNYQQQAPMMITHYFSTTSDPSVALHFLRTGTYETNNTVFPLLFKINVRQEDISIYCPFASISRYSAFDGENETLFSPGQLFLIEKFEITHDFIHSKGAFVYQVDIRLYNQADSILSSIYTGFQIGPDTENRVSLLQLANIAQTYNRHDEAKEIYLRVLDKEKNQETQIACYSGLSIIASIQGDVDKARLYESKKYELQFHKQDVFSGVTSIHVSNENAQQFDRLSVTLKQAYEKLFSDSPLNELISFSESQDLKNTTTMAQNLLFNMASSCMTGGNTEVAIFIFQQILGTMNCMFGRSSLFDHLLQSKCYMKIGHCFYQLKQYETAIDNYTLALKSEISLPLEVYEEIVSGIGIALVMSNRFEDALAKYIELDERYKNEPMDSVSSNVKLNEERIEHVLSCIFSRNM